LQAADSSGLVLILILRLSRLFSGHFKHSPLMGSESKRPESAGLEGRPPGMKPWRRHFVSY
jgi:hypothetical protein